MSNDFWSKDSYLERLLEWRPDSPLSQVSHDLMNRITGVLSTLDLISEDVECGNITAETGEAIRIARQGALDISEIARAIAEYEEKIVLR